LSVVTVTCTNNICQVKVPAPGFALVFLTDNAYTEDTPATPLTFSTTVTSKARVTVSVDPLLLATSNGHSGLELHLGSTSKETFTNGGLVFVPSTVALVALTMCVMLVGQRTG